MKTLTDKALLAIVGVPCSILLMDPLPTYIDLWQAEATSINYGLPFSPPNKD